VIFKDGVPLGILFEGHAFNERQGQRLSIQVKVQGVYAGMPVQRAQCADGQRHRLGGRAALRLASWIDPGATMRRAESSKSFVLPCRLR
jgi:hypothetical protein